MKHFFALSLALALLSTIASISRAAELHVSAAASMTEPLKEMVKIFAGQQPDITVILNFGSSGAMAKQIDQGAPCDLFISANPKWMTFLAEQHSIDKKSERVLATNALVFVGRPNPAIKQLTDLPALARIGIGSPTSVPAGQYGAQALAAAGIYDQLSRDGKLVMAKDVRQALLYADRGETDGSFVYRTDAALAANAVILFTVPETLHDPIVYPVALTAAGAVRAEARSFYDFLISPAAGDVLARFGFTVTP